MHFASCCLICYIDFRYRFYYIPLFYHIIIIILTLYYVNYVQKFIKAFHVLRPYLHVPHFFVGVWFTIFFSLFFSLSDSFRRAIQCDSVTMTKQGLYAWNRELHKKYTWVQWAHIFYKLNIYLIWSLVQYDSCLSWYCSDMDICRWWSLTLHTESQKEGNSIEKLKEEQQHTVQNRKISRKIFQTKLVKL